MKNFFNKIIQHFTYILYLFLLIFYLLIFFKIFVFIIVLLIAISKGLNILFLTLNTLVDLIIFFIIVYYRIELFTFRELKIGFLILLGYLLIMYICFGITIFDLLFGLYIGITCLFFNVNCDIINLVFNSWLFYNKN